MDLVSDIVVDTAVLNVVAVTLCVVDAEGVISDQPVDGSLKRKRHNGVARLRDFTSAEVYHAVSKLVCEDKNRLGSVHLEKSRRWVVVVASQLPLYVAVETFLSKSDLHVKHGHQIVAACVEDPLDGTVLDESQGQHRLACVFAVYLELSRADAVTGTDWLIGINVVGAVDADEHVALVGPEDVGFEDDDTTVNAVGG